METFSEWLVQILKEKNMTQAELSRLSGVTNAQISRVINGSRGIGPEAIAAIARALRLPPERVFEKAGILPPKPQPNPAIDEITHLAGILPPEDVQDLIDLAHAKLDRYERINKHARNSTPLTPST